MRTPLAPAFALALSIIREREAFVAHPYLCPAGHWTIGYGCTAYANGMAVKPNDPSITQAQGEVLAEALLVKVDHQLRPLLNREPTANQYAAMLSLAFNCGVGIHDGKKGDLADSTLLEKFNASDRVGAADEFLKWDKAHVSGKVVTLDGLHSRRVVERAIFLGGGR